MSTPQGTAEGARSELVLQLVDEPPGTDGEPAEPAGTFMSLTEWSGALGWT